MVVNKPGTREAGNATSTSAFGSPLSVASKIVKKVRYSLIGIRLSLSPTEVIVGMIIMPVPTSGTLVVLRRWSVVKQEGLAVAPSYRSSTSAAGEAPSIHLVNEYWMVFILINEVMIWLRRLRTRSARYFLL